MKLLLQNFICLIYISIFLVVSNIFYGFFRLGDDTYIYLQYVRSIIDRGEIAFNPGEPIYGFTSPIWLALLTTVIGITGNYFQSPHFLSVAFSVLTIIVWFVITNKSKLNTWIRYLIMGIISLDPNLIKHSYLGMEASATFFLSSLVILILLLNDSKSIQILLPLLFGLYFLLRPESVIIYVIIMLTLFSQRKNNINELLIMFFISLLVVVPWVIFSWIYFGNIIPTTFLAKGGGYSIGTRFFNHFFDSIKIFVGNYLPVIAAIFLYLIHSFITNFNSKYKYLIAVAFLSIFCFIIFYTLTLNRELLYARYYCIIFPFLYLLLVILLNETQIKLNYVNVSLVLIILYSVAITVVFSNLTKKSFMIDTVEDKIAAWVKENSNPFDSIIRVRIGKIGFISERKIVDPMGIINPEIIEYNKNGNSVEYYAIHRPDYAIGLSEHEIEQINKYARTEMVYEFKDIPVLFPRQMILGGKRIENIAIYRLNWQ